jgi:hypothetical protein
MIPIKESQMMIPIKESQMTTAGNGESCSAISRQNGYRLPNYLQSGQNSFGQVVARSKEELGS